jgi:hypothetical protein
VAEFSWLGLSVLSKTASSSACPFSANHENCGAVKFLVLINGHTVGMKYLTFFKGNRQGLVFDKDLETFYGER